MFNELKYNLYEILNLTSCADVDIIKKICFKMLKKFHPDKNSEIEKELYYHIVSAKNILLDNLLREAYDNFLLEKNNTFNELKENFQKINIKPSDPMSFNYLVNELNNKHNYNENNYNENVINKFKLGRNNIIIEKTNIKDNDDFNNQFNNNKINGKFKNQILEEYKGDASENSDYTIGETFTYINDINKLYIEDTVDNNKYCSLNRAFSLQSI